MQTKPLSINKKHKKDEYAQAIKLDFLTNLMKNWKKRNHKLLHIGINHSIEPSFFWDLGFEVTAFAHNLDDLDESQKRNGKRIEYVQGVADYLPFEDKTFDYVVLTHTLASNSTLNLPKHSRIQNFKHALTKNQYKNSIKNNTRNKARKNLINSQKSILENIVQEAVRVCANSVLILENNSFAFDILNPALSPFYLNQICEHADKHHHSLYFSLSLPSILWFKAKAMRSLLALPHKIPFSSFIALQIDISQEVMTSLPNYITYTAEEI